MKVEEESEKAGLKLNIQKIKITASLPITSWQIYGETMETVRDFIFLGSKIPAGGDCSHEIKRRLLLGRKAMTNLDSIFKSRNITDKGPSCQSCGFSSSHVWMWETIKKPERRRIDAFELWCWRRLLRVPWTARRSNQSVLKEINPEYSLGGLMLKLILQFFGYLMWRTDSLEKTLITGKDLRLEEKGLTEDEMVGWYHRLDEHEFEQAPGVGDEQGSLACCSPWGHKESDMTEELNWIQLNWLGIEEWLYIQGVFICLLVPFFGHFFRKAPIPCVSDHNFCTYFCRPSSSHTYFSFLYLSNSCPISPTSLSILITSWSFSFLLKCEGQGCHFNAVAYKLCGISGEYDSQLILANGAGALLEEGSDLCHLCATQIQVSNFTDVFSSPLSSSMGDSLFWFSLLLFQYH